MLCVVCGEGLSPKRTLYANSWESALGQRGCCSDICVASFDADRHWIPSRKPPPIDAGEQDKLLASAKVSLRNGDAGAVVARDLLLAGVSPYLTRNAVAGASMAGAASRRTAGWLSALSFLGGGLWLSRDKRTGSFGDANAIIAEWEERFGSSAE
ncbi:MAG: hypothetical protein ACI9KE_005153 [Polyangiales bacterium]|jgi:hypothetical protein